MLQNIAAAKRLGHDVVLVVPREGMSPAKARLEVENALRDFGISEDISVKRIPRPAFQGRFKRSFDFLAACWARTKDFDLIWSREFHAADYTTAFGLNTIVEHHHPFTARQWRVARRMLRRNSFKGVAAISGVHQRLLLSNGWPESKVIVAHSGVDLSRFAAFDNIRDIRGKLAEPEQPIILYAGSLYGGKGCEQIVLAAARLKSVKFVCIGGRDSEVARFKDQIKLQGLNNIEFTGYLPHALIPKYLLAADILIAPFTEEGCDIAGKVIIPFSSPIKIFEYMAAGKPIIASHIGAIPEIITHEKNGLLIAPGDVDGLIRVISRLLEAPALAARLGVTAREHVRSYSWEVRVTHVIEFALGSVGKSRRQNQGANKTQEKPA